MHASVYPYFCTGAAFFEKVICRKSCSGCPILASSKTKLLLLFGFREIVNGEGSPTASLPPSGEVP
jgi:hypothetical protein